MLEDNWYLEGYYSEETALSRLPINHFPFQIGRQKGIGFIVPSKGVSRIHAEITLEDDQLLLRDMGSTNGTFVNRKKMDGQILLQHGDILHFADFEVRLIREVIVESSEPTMGQATIVGIPGLSTKMPAGVRELQELLDAKMVIPAYQPIIESATEAIHAYEILGRGTHLGLSRNPGPLFHIAESVNGLAMHLSRLFRDTGVAAAATFDSNAKFFMNIHPEELKYVRLLLLDIEKFRKQHPQLSLVLEIHEKAITNLSDMKKIGRELENMGVQLAYDDFGAGQARFIELIEAPPDYLKFDIGLVRKIDTAPEAKRNMVQMLVSMSKDMGIYTLAEGLDRMEEVQICRDMGFDYIQGFFYGRPKDGAL